VEYNNEYRVVHKDTGQIRWVKDHGVPVRDEKGDVLMYDGLIIDVDERKRVEKEIKRLKEKYEDLILNIPCVVDSALPDESGAMTFISDRYTNWTGYSPEDFYKDPGLWPKTVHPEDREEAVDTWAEACRNKDTGQIRWVKDHGVPVRDEKGDVLMYDGLIVDVTARREAEQALKESEEFSSSLLENAPNPVVVINADTSVRYVNPALTSKTGFSDKELLEIKPPYPWWTKEGREENSARLCRAMGEKMSGVEQLFQRKNGVRFWVKLSSAPVMSGGQFKYLLINWVDITEQKRLREDMQQYISKITMAQEQERKRISRELHDKTVQSLADLCTDVDVIAMNEKLPVGVSSHLSQLRLKVQRVMNDLRRFSYELRPGMLDYFGLIPSLEALVEDWKKEGRLNCRVEVTGPEQRLQPEAEVILFRIIQEGLRNVLKHSGASEALARIEFVSDKVKINIRDNGTGFKVPKELGSFTRSGKLGLMGMKERVNLLGGRFWVHSKPGKGTTVTAEVPV